MIASSAVVTKKKSNPLKEDGFKQDMPKPNKELVVKSEEMQLLKHRGPATLTIEEVASEYNSSCMAENRLSSELFD
jgi:hypothetical protein